MKSTDSLRQVLSQLNWHSARITLLSNVILSLIKVRTVNLTQLAISFETKCKTSSNYRRLQRFLKSFPLDYDLVAKLIANFLPDEPWVLCMDRTNWKFGKLNINILVLAVANKGIAVPLFWTFLNKKGNSNTDERKYIINRFLSVFPIEKIKYLTADREFKGQIWIKYLLEENIPFRIRIPNNTKVFNRHRCKKTYVQRLFRLTMDEFMVLNTPYKLWGCNVYIGCLKK